MTKLILLVLVASYVSLGSANEGASIIRIDPATIQCPGANEVFKSCGTRCPQVCGKPSRICTADCFPSCQCIDNYIRATNGECIPNAKCAASLKPIPICGTNEVYTGCGRDRRCGQLRPTGKRGPGCHCIIGMVRNFNGVCVPEDQCPMVPPPMKCTGGAVYTTCGTCDEVCNREPMMCTMACRTGCYCPRDHARNAEGQCVPKSRC